LNVEPVEAIQWEYLIEDRGCGNTSKAQIIPKKALQNARS